MQVGDIVKLKPELWREDNAGLVVERENPLILHVLWTHNNELERVNQQYLELINAAR